MSEGTGGDGAELRVFGGVGGEPGERVAGGGAATGADGADETGAGASGERGEPGEQRGVRLRPGNPLQGKARDIGGGVGGEQAGERGHGGGGADEGQLVAEEVSSGFGQSRLPKGSEQLRFQSTESSGGRAGDLFTEDRRERAVTAVLQLNDLGPGVHVRTGFGSDHDDAVG